MSRSPRVSRRLVAAASILASATLLGACTAQSSSIPTTTSRHGPGPTTSVPTTPPPSSPAATLLEDIAFFDAEHGYGLFQVNGTGACRTEVGRTSNGGSVFSAAATVFQVPCQGVQPSARIAFDDHGDGFVFGTGLFVTHDAGATWVRVAQRSDVLSVEALGRSVWMLEGGCQSPVVGPCPYLLVRSSDGGRIWTSSRVPRGATSLVRTGPSSAFVVGTTGAVNGNLATTTPMWFTSTSGASWASRTIDCASFGNAAVSVTPGGTVFAVCPGQPGAGQQMKETMMSSDAGRHWSVQSSCSFNHVEGAICTPGSQTGGYVNEIDAVSSSTIYMVGDRAPLSVSHSAGVRWSTGLPGSVNVDDGTQRVVFFSPTSGVVLGSWNSRTIWSTSDVGAHWVAHVARLS